MSLSKPQSTSVASSEQAAKKEKDAASHPIEVFLRKLFTAALTATGVTRLATAHRSADDRQSIRVWAAILKAR